MDIIRLSRHSKYISGEINLEGSKSISNRLLIIQALSHSSVSLSNLSISSDTQILNRLLHKQQSVRDAEDCGTAFRFLTAYFCIQPGEQTLTGSVRMLERPIQPLVDALREMGANIEYLGIYGYPPLKIGQSSFGEWNEIQIPAHISSQFISAICLIAPCLRNGCKIMLKGKINSLPYIDMTLRLMKACGVRSHFDLSTQSIIIKEQQYTLPPEYTIESDWSAAAFYYVILSIAEKGSVLKLNGLFRKSSQGDAVIAEIGHSFGILTEFSDKGILISKVKSIATDSEFNFDFSHCPDLAQPIMVMCAANQIKATLTGLASLKIKETDRIAAMKNELNKFNIQLKLIEGLEEGITLKGKFIFNSQVSVETYYDHRMAMSLAPLSMYHTLDIQNPVVVNKSYPGFWKDLEKIGFTAKRLSEDLIS